jgi:hypothetical protein
MLSLDIESIMRINIVVDIICPNFFFNNKNEWGIKKNFTRIIFYFIY